jgi:hypothetical protein
MSYNRRDFVHSGFLALLLLGPTAGHAQYRQEPGHSIGTVTTQGNLIVLTLDENVLGKANLFNLAHHTLRFTPQGSQYTVETIPWRWDSEFGPEMLGSEATLKSFVFPFSGKSWNTFSVGITGSMTFGEPARPAGARPGTAQGNRTGGLSVDRFAELQRAGPTFINTVPAISVFFKPRLIGTRYLKESSDQALITWSLTEPFGGIQDMSWTSTVNRFQAVLHKDGTIEFSYDEVQAEDAVVGLYPMVTAGSEKEIAAVDAGTNAAVAPHLDIARIRLAAVDGLFLKATIEMRGPALQENDPALAGIIYRICLDREKPTGCTQDNSTVWTILGGGGHRRNGPGTPHYVAFGPGMLSAVKISANTISVEGTLPADYGPGDSVFLSAATQTPGTPLTTVDQVLPHAIKLAGLASPSVHLSSLKKSDGPFPVVYEVFHYMKPPGANDLTCSIIRALGDRFDMLAYYSDFRIDNPEAGTSSTGPLGGGPSGGAVTGIHAEQDNLAGFCTQGRFQWQFIQPVYVGANQMQQYPPDGYKDTNTRNIGAYMQQLAERTANGKIPAYDYAMSQIGHEMGHRWSAFVSARVGNETIDLGPTHWATGLQAQVAFPYQRPTEASAMGGGVWQNNYDGTFTQLDDDYYVPATGWSYLDLYLMGLISPAEVPDFFILRNLVPAGHDSNGHAMFKADRTKVTIQDVIAAEGPRLPAVDQAQKNFNTGMVMVVEHGKTPSARLIENVNGIRERWIDYWTTTTGHRSSMTADSK